MLPTGELLVVNVTRIDAQKTYRCRTHHRLTQEASVSRNEGKIQLTDMRGSVPPILNRKVVIVSARAEDTVVVPCVAYANPRPSYRWYQKRDRQEVPVENNDKFLVQDGTLVISGLKRNDSGTYVCVATNSEGSESLELQLTVTSPLSVHVHPVSQTAHLGKGADLECNILGFPWSSVLWLKDGQPLRFGSRVRLSSETRVQILSMEKEDRGMYQCLVKSEVETKVYPQLTYRFIEQTMQPGPSVSLKCSASGNPTPQISWFLDGFRLMHSDRLLIGQYVSLFGDVISHVNISSVKPEDGGEYECLVENRAGKVSHSARLNIYGLPYVRPMPAISAVAGKELTIKCPVAGYPIDVVTWEKDGVRLPTTLRQRVANNTLTIENIQRDTDQGAYSCSARNKQGHNSQRTVEVKVIVPPKITPFTFARDLKLGDRISVQCVVVSGDLPLAFVWLKDGSPPSESEKVTVRRYDPFTSALTIGAIAPTHSGNYTCRATNEAATVSHTAPLRVNVPPYWIVEPAREQNVILGNPISLHCQADGFPKPVVTWKQALGPDEYREITYNTPNMIRLENGSLAILKATEEHEGYYMCEANNGVGAGKSKFIHLVIHAPPRFAFKTKQETARKGEAAYIKCEAEGDVPMEIVWRMRGSELRPNYDQRYILKNTTLPKGMVSELTILEANHRDRGEYVCQANNAYGQDHMIVHLLIQEPPTSPRNLNAEVQSGRSIMLAWSPPTSDEDAKVTNYILQFKESRDVWHEHNSQKMVPGDQTMTLVTGLKPATSYHFRLYAENQLGTSSASDIIAATTETEPPSGAPQKVSAEPLSSTAVRVTWQPPERKLWNGDLLGYNIGFRRLKSDNDGYNWTYTKLSFGLPGDFRLTGLFKFTKYAVVVTANNVKGDGPASDPVIVETLEDVPDEPPQDIQCMALTSYALQLNWRPPSAARTNGIVQGYKIVYESTNELFESTRETKVTNAVAVTLHGLQPYTNYSLQISAFTNAGDGARSPVTYCVTEESIPEAPASVKAVVNSEDTVIVSWLPPRRSNGVLTKYTVYVRVIDHGTELKVIKGTLPPQHLHYEAVGLKKKEKYEAWVTASTKAGQGPSTAVVQLVPGSVVPAAIVSFGRTIVVPWKTEVRLPCLHVGQPRPTVEWRLGDVRIQKRSRNIIIEDKSLVLEDVGRNNEGNYSCHVRNNLGADHITFLLIVQVPPTPPLLLATAVTSSSVQLQWKQGDTGGTPVRGFILSYRKESREWMDLTLEPQMTSYLIDSLDCGTNYQFRLTAFNKIGSGVASKLNTVVTKGSRPIPPSRTAFLAINSTSVILHLRTWADGGCPITRFSLTTSGRILDNIDPFHEFVLDQLLPGTEYTIAVTAHNSAGSVTQEYVFITAPAQRGNSILSASAEFVPKLANIFRSQSTILGNRGRRAFQLLLRRHSNCDFMRGVASSFAARRHGDMLLFP
ncbi:UNVERIFIED_CONTAM: hypothetical protein PYX00_010567 [Menopon gallinae]|uniref:Down syndrome cell adhesion molecule-like protein Dscam2 n=1 Tax=Menopon gallinae TaxID=328185 RepID=A0AAW2HG52_9NEOP